MSAHSGHSAAAAAAQYHHDGPSTVERLSQFLCTPKNRVRLPPPPLRCKFLKYPHDADRFTKWKGTTLELHYQWELHHDSIFALPLDLMDPDYFCPLKERPEYDDLGVPNREKDRKILQLLEEREAAKSGKEEQAMPEQEAFLLQTQYLTGGREYELTENQRKSYDREERRNKKSRRRHRRSDSDSDGYGDGGYGRRQNPHSVENVAKTFIDVEQITKHPRRNVEVERTFDVFPHDECLEWEYTHCHFDNDPAGLIKKCNFMPSLQEERLKMAQKCSEHGLLRCVNQRALELERRRGSKMEVEEDEDDDLEMAKVAGREADWFSLYATNGERSRRSDYDLADHLDFEWTAEFVPVQMEKKQMRFMVIPRAEDGEVFYANLHHRLSLRHRATDSSHGDHIMAGAKKGLSEGDKKFFKMTPMHLTLNLPFDNEEDDED